MNKTKKNKKLYSKDKSTKVVFDRNEVFCEVFNEFMYNGEKVLIPDELIDGPTESQYKSVAGNLNNQYRDVFKYFHKQGYIIAGCGIENQSSIDWFMPIRIMGYDYASYRKQVKNYIEKGNSKAIDKSGESLDNKSNKAFNNRIYPVLTLVLNFSDRRWNGPKSIKELVDCDDGRVLKNVSDYKIHVIDVAFLEDEQIAQFKTMFKHVAHFMKHKNDDYYYPLEDKVDDTEALLDFMQTFGGEEYANVKEEYNSLVKDKNGGDSMSTIMEKWYNKGRDEGLDKGREEGRDEGRIVLAYNLYCENTISLDIAASKCNMTPDEFLNYAKTHNLDEQ
ncbi:MAG: Rpn family recombination-promoting nuclease/putative transposase [Lachnospiraceae bacterium]|nr:Rpn family recombination-promoting nuclease/putative transposase [Lachnospiraceae bacterium]